MEKTEELHLHYDDWYWRSLLKTYIFMKDVKVRNKRCPRLWIVCSNNVTFSPLNKPSLISFDFYRYYWKSTNKSSEKIIAVNIFHLRHVLLNGFQMSFFSKVCVNSNFKENDLIFIVLKETLKFLQLIFFKLMLLCCHKMLLN